MRSFRIPIFPGSNVHRGERPERAFRVCQGGQATTAGLSETKSQTRQSSGKFAPGPERQSERASGRVTSVTANLYESASRWNSLGHFKDTLELGGGLGALENFGLWFALVSDAGTEFSLRGGMFCPSSEIETAPVSGNPERRSFGLHSSTCKRGLCTCR